MAPPPKRRVDSIGTGLSGWTMANDPAPRGVVMVIRDRAF